MNLKKTRLLILITLLTTIVITGCLKEEVIETKANRSRVAVETVEIQREDFKHKLDINGTLFGLKELKVFAEGEGRLVELNIAEGSEVSKGEVIGELRKDLLLAQKGELKANLAVAEAKLAQIEAGARKQEVNQAQLNVEQVQIEHDEILSEYESLKILYQQEMISEREFESIESKYKLAEIKLKLAQESLDLIKAGARQEEKDVYQAQVEQAQVALEQLRIKLADTTIEAPISGIITETFIEEGEMLTPNSPLAHLVKMEQILLKAGISSKDLASLQKGQTVVIEVDSYSGEKFIGELINKAQRVDPQSRTIEVEVKLDNSDYRLKPGIFAFGEIITEILEKVIILPKRVVKSTGGDEYSVYIVEDGRVKERRIEIEEVAVDKFLVTSGLESGEQVITSNLNQLRNGDEIYSPDQRSDN